MTFEAPCIIEPRPGLSEARFKVEFRRGARFAAEEEGIYKVPGAAAKRMQQLGDSIIKLQKAREEAAAAARRESSASPLRNTILFRNQSKRPRPLGDEGGSGKDVTFAVQV